MKRLGTLLLIITVIAIKAHATAETETSQVNSSTSPAPMPTLASLLIPEKILYTHAMYLILVLQPIFMLACQFAPALMASLITNPHTSTVRANFGSNGLNFQTINMLVYHTSLTDRVLHTATFTLDAFAQASLAIHGWGPLIIQVYTVIGSQIGLGAEVGAQIGRAIVVGVLLFYAFQCWSLGGFRLLAGMTVVWSFICFVLLTTEFILFADLPTDLADGLSRRVACLILMGGAFTRSFGHMADHQNVGVIGNHSFMAEYVFPPQTWQEWTTSPLRSIKQTLFFTVRLVCIAFAATMAEFNAGLPYRLFPVLVHLVMLRLELNANPTSNFTPFIPTNGGGDHTNVKKKKRLPPPHPLMNLREINRTASFIVHNGWQACTANVALQLQLKEEERQLAESKVKSDTSSIPPAPTPTRSNRRFTCRSGIDTFLTTEAKERLSQEEGLPTSASHPNLSLSPAPPMSPISGVVSPLPVLRKHGLSAIHVPSRPASASPESSPRASPLSPTIESSPNWMSRHFPSMDIQKSYQFSIANTFLHCRRGIIFPFEQTGYQVWGIWPEIEPERDVVAKPRTYSE